MATVTRWLTTTVLAAGLGFATLAAPAPARADDDLVRVIVDIADVIHHGGYPYYRYGGGYGYGDRLIVERDRYGRPIYYRTVRSGPPYGKAHGYWKKHQPSRVSCDRRGRCTTRYYDPRYDRRYDNRYYSYDRYRHDRDGRYWDGRRWRDYDRD